MKQKFLKGTLIGTVIGAVGGLLLAPKKGQDTLDDLKGKTRQLKSETEDKTDASQRALKRIKREAQREGGRFWQRVKTIIDEAADEIKPSPKVKSRAKTKPKAKSRPATRNKR